MAEHFEILWLPFRCKCWVSETGCKARSFNWHLSYTANVCRRLNPNEFEKCGHQIAGVRELVAELAPTADSLGPANHKRITNAATVRILLIAAQWRVGRHGPTQWEIRVRPGAADFVDACEFLGERLIAQVARTA